MREGVHVLLDVIKGGGVVMLCAMGGKALEEPILVEEHHELE